MTDELEGKRQILPIMREPGISYRPSSTGWVKIMNNDDPEEHGTRLEGRELAIAIHEEIFGESVPDVSPDDSWWQHLPDYPGDISAAMLVVEKLVEMGFYVDIGVDEHGAQVQLNYYEGEYIHWNYGESIRGKDVPEAICRAALKAVV